MLTRFDNWIRKNPGLFLTIFFASLTFAILFMLMLFVAGEVFLDGSSIVNK